MKTMQTRTKNKTCLVIDRSKLCWNIRAIRKRIGDAPILAMLKGNAYGMGLPEVARTLRTEGINIFGVQTIDEAQALRRADCCCIIVNFCPFTESWAETAIQENISPVLYDQSQINILKKYITRVTRPLPVFLKINTGLNRWGVREDASYALAQSLISIPKVSLQGFITTLTEDKKIDDRQIKALQKIITNLKQEGFIIPYTSYASSQYMLTTKVKQADLVRPGITLFGQYPDKKTSKHQCIKLKSICTLKSFIGQLQSLKAGDSLMYKQAFIAKQYTRIAVIPVGYAQGYNPLLSQKADVLINGSRCKILAISMGTTIVDVTTIKKIRVGQNVVLIGKQKNDEITFEELSDLSGLSIYYLMTSLASNLERIYIH